MRYCRYNVEPLEVMVRAEKDRIVIEPVCPKIYELEELLKGITTKNLHDAVDFGPPEGKEIW